MMHDALSIPGLLSMAAGFTDNAVLPKEAVRSAVESLTRNETHNAHLQYGTTQGRLELRRRALEHVNSFPGEDLSALHSTRNCAIANGSQQALYISVQLFCEPGDIVLVQQPSYFVFLELLEGLGVHALSIPVDESGTLDVQQLALSVQQLEQAGLLPRLKLCYLMGYNANPSSRCLSLEEKTQLGRYFATLDRPLPVIEDGAYRSLYYDQPWPVPSILSLPEWQELTVCYTETFTKPFATGLKIGYAISNRPEWIANILRTKAHQDFGSGHFDQCVLEETIRSGSYAAQLERARPHYAAKMQLLTDTLRAEGLPERGWRWDTPQGGLLLWLQGPDGLDVSMDSDFCRQCLEQKVLYVPGHLAYAHPFEGLPDAPALAGEGIALTNSNETRPTPASLNPVPRNTLRLAIGSLDKEKLVEAARRFCRVALSVKDG